MSATRQDVSGSFNMRLRGLPFLFGSSTRLVSSKRNRLNIRSLHLSLLWWSLHVGVARVPRESRWSGDRCSR